MDYFENIHAYLDGELSQEEARSFESELEKNEELAAEVQIQRTMREGIFAAGLREQMQEFAAGNQQETPVRQAKTFQLRRYVSLAVAASVAVLLGVFLWNNGGVSSTQGDAFASVYYTDPGTPVAMGETKDRAFDEAMVLYKQGDFESASRAFDPLCDLSADVRSCYYQAQSALQLQDYAQAKTIFDVIIKHTSDQEYIEKSQWYMAYILFQQDEAGYEELLTEIKNDPGHRFNLEATEVLKNL